MPYAVFRFSEDLSTGCPEEGVYSSPDSWQIESGMFRTAKQARAAAAAHAKDIHPSMYSRTTFMVAEVFVVEAETREENRKRFLKELSKTDPVRAKKYQREIREAKAKDAAARKTEALAANPSQRKRRK